MSENECGELIATITPYAVGIRIGRGGGFNASWPFFREFLIYQRGLYVGNFMSNSWVPRSSITSIRVGLFSLRIKWTLGGRRIIGHDYQFPSRTEHLSCS